MQPLGGVAHRPRIVRDAWVVAVPLLLVAVAGLLLGLSRDDGTGTATAGPPAGVSASDPGRAYLETARSYGVAEPGEVVLGTARNACGDLNAGGDVAHVAHYVAVRHDLADPDARVVLRAGLRAVCPAHEGEVHAS